MQSFPAIQSTATMQPIPAEGYARQPWRDWRPAPTATNSATPRWGLPSVCPTDLWIFVVWGWVGNMIKSGGVLDLQGVCFASPERA